MKKTVILSIVAIVILVSSCTKELDQLPLSSATVPTFYLQTSDFVQAVNAAYNSLRAYPDRLLFLSEVRSDNIYPTNDVGRDPDPINNFQQGITANIYVEEGWREDFRGIFQANTALEQISQNSSKIGNAALATRLTAEARFLRAFYYFDLVKYYGKVPLIDHTVLADEANTIRRSSVDSVYKLIIGDLQFAAANLPLNYAATAAQFPLYGATDIGRATKYAAEAVLAQVYMARSGPNYGIEGPGMGLNEWGLALPLLQDIITNGGFVFNPNFSGATGIFSYTNQNPSTNKEAVFDVMYITGQTPVLGATFLWQLVPQNYFNSFSNPSTSGALGFPAVSKNLVNSYAATDTRKSPTIHTTPFTYSGTTYTDPFIRKYLDTTKNPATNSRFDWAINFIAVRYTDILLLKAECVLNGATGSQVTDVDAVVNQVRTRAGLTALTGITKAQLLDERRREFAGEGSRWFDLQRSGNLVTIMNAWIATEDAALRKMNQVTPNYILYPVPQTQLDAAPGLYTQNPGY